jgi:hypothetical protein
MFRISPSRKDTATATTTTATATATATDPVTIWTTQRQFRFPPTLSIYDDTTQSSHNDNTRHRVIHDVPRPNTSLYRLISQYNPWLDCEMTREKRAFLKPRAGELCYPVYNDDTSLAFFRNETIMDIVNLYIWPLLHSRADEVVACRTFADWRCLFSQTISLAFPDYGRWVSIATVASVSSTFVPISDQRRTAQIMKYMTPARVLYLLTISAGFWPYGASSSSSSPRSSRNAGRGLCAIKLKVKEYNDKTEIDWLVGADFLRKMKRFHLYFTTSVAQVSQITNTLLHIDTDSE